MDKALGTSSAVFCFFTMWMRQSGITSCRGNGKIQAGSKVTWVKDGGGASIAARETSVYLCVLEQNGGVEAGVGLGDVEPAVVGHLLLQGAHVR